jgi:hypothetical protein
MSNPNAILCATYAARIDDASTLEDLAALYEEIIGYDPVADDPTSTAEGLRETLQDYVADLACTYER